MYLGVNVKVLCFVNITLCCVWAVYLENNAYKGVTIAFSSSITEEEINTTKLMNVIRKSSKLLYKATRRRSFLAEVDLLYPSTWSNPCSDDAPKDAGFQIQGISVYVTNSTNEDSLRAQHSKGCGEKGEVIYMPSPWLNGNEEELSREFVQQWAIYRYGVFEEKMEPGDWPCFTKDGEHWIQTGCYNIDFSVNLTLDSNGLPFCENSGSRDEINIKSSLMAATRSSNITDFCDGSKLLPHSPLAPTRHNRICRGRPVWNVIKESEDFIYGRNPPRGMDYVPPSVSFRCFEERPSHIIFSIQTGSKENDQNTEKIVDNLRLSLLRFLAYDAPPETEVSIIVFQDVAVGPIHFNLTDREQLYENLNSYVRANRTEQDVCLSCGLQSAFELSKESEYKNAAVVLVIFASTLKSRNLGEFTDLMESSPSVTHLIVIQDIQGDFNSPNLVKVTRRTGGNVFMVPSSRALMITKLSMYLTSFLRSPLKVQDSVAIIHHASFFYINTPIVDVVEADISLEGKMTYTVICDTTDSNRLRHNISENCIELNEKVAILWRISSCYKTTLAKDTRKWSFSLRDEGGISPLNCSSLATVQLQSDAKDALTVTGWLNMDTFEPGGKALIIYAEVMYNSVPIINATINAAVYSSNNVKPTMIELLDTGNGDPDMKKGDGIYSRYFTRIHNRGIHTVIIHANGYLENHGSAETAQDDLRFSRVVPIGSFLVTEQPKYIDYYPPNRIGDLKVAKINHTSSVVTLQWTAPGDNFDNGTVHKYDMKFSLTSNDLQESTFEMENSATLENSFKDMLIQTSGNLQMAIIQLPPPIRENTPYYVAIRAINKNDDTSLVSNIVQILFSISAPERTTVVPDTSTSEEPYKFTSTNVTNTSETHHTTEISVSSNNTVATTANDTTEDSTVSSTFTIVEAKTENTTTETIVAKEENDSCKHIIVLASSIGGGILLLLLIINATACICFKKQKRPKKLSRKASLRPPHNMTVVPKTPANDYSFSLPQESLREELQDFEVDMDYTFVPGNQQSRNIDQNYYETARITQADLAGYTNVLLTNQYKSAEGSMTDSAPNTFASRALQHRRNDREDSSEANAISLGIV